MTPEQAADFWRNGANYLGSMCAQNLHENDLESARKYARWHDKALHRAILAGAHVAGIAFRRARTRKIDWLGEGTD
jgi:hypothetical protein